MVLQKGGPGASKVGGHFSLFRSKAISKKKVLVLEATF